MKQEIQIEQVADKLRELIDSLSHFAHTFELPLTGVFPGLSNRIAAQGSKACATQWLSSQDSSFDCLQQLLGDFKRHHSALLSSLDGVAVRTLEVMEPYLKQQVTSTDPVAILTSHHRCYAILEDLKSNPALRYQKIVAPGVLSRYVHNRKFLKTRAAEELIDA